MRSNTLRAVARHLADENPALVRACLEWDTEEFEYVTEDGERLNPTVAEAVYWLGVNWHSGAASPLYAAQCRSGWDPGPVSRGPEDGDSAEVLYAELKAIVRGG